LVVRSAYVYVRFVLFDSFCVVGWLIVDSLFSFVAFLVCGLRSLFFVGSRDPVPVLFTDCPPASFLIPSRCCSVSLLFTFGCYVVTFVGSLAWFVRERFRVHLRCLVWLLFSFVVLALVVRTFILVCSFPVPYVRLNVCLDVFSVWFRSRFPVVPRVRFVPFTVCGYVRLRSGWFAFYVYVCFAFASRLVTTAFVRWLRCWRSAFWLVVTVWFALIYYVGCVIVTVLVERCGYLFVDCRCV